MSRQAPPQPPERRSSRPAKGLRPGSTRSADRLRLVPDAAGPRATGELFIPGEDDGTDPDGRGAGSAAPGLAAEGREALTGSVAGDEFREARGRAGRRNPPDARSLDPNQRVRRAVTLLLVQFLAPGSAELAVGNRRLGRFVLRIWAGFLAFLVLLGLLWLVARRLVLALATSPPVLVLAGVAGVVAALALMVLLVDAWRLGRPDLLPRRVRGRLAALLALLVLVGSGSLVAVSQRMWAAADLITGVFAGTHSSNVVDGRLNVLLLGGDAGPDRVGTRPDSITLVSIDAGTGATVLFSLPRNLEEVPFAPGSAAAKAMPKGFACGDNCLLNGVYTWGQQHASLFPGARDPGAEAMKQAVQGITGLTVNYYVLIDLKGFAQLVDAMGGVRITVGARVPIGGGTSKVSGYLEPGAQTLDGYHALWFARSRHGADDYARMSRQRCVMDAMLHQLDPATVLARFQSIAAAGRNVVSTDIPSGDLATFIDLATKARGQRVTSVQFVPPLIQPAYPDYRLIRDRVAAALAGRPVLSPATTATAAPSPRGSVRPTTKAEPAAGTGAGGRTAKPSEAGSSTPTASGVDVSLDAACAPA
ncbi:MAG TPA: LCP family protein [Kineosporiaceae bacterium]|nr:LCP family protein [Kineosporiaceae bacterium]